MNQDNKRIKHIEVVEYNPTWPAIFDAEAAAISKALADNLIAIHHIGSTAVPGLAAKPKLDILAVVKDLHATIANLTAINLQYQYRGEYNVPLHYGFSKHLGQAVNLHVAEENHGFTSLNLCFRDYLRANIDAREAYALLKTNLLKQASSFVKINSHFSGYNLGKDQFIKNILAKAGFNDFMLNFCLHNNEWQRYHSIREQQIFAPINIAYDHNHPSLTAANNFHFVLYKGNQIVCVAQVEFLPENVAALRTIATENDLQRQGFAKHMLQLLEKWCSQHGKHVIKLHARLNAANFYRKLGYTEMEFADPSLEKNCVNLGKLLSTTVI